MERKDKKLSRRDFLRGAAVVGGASVLAACAQPTAAPAPAATTAPAAAAQPAAQAPAPTTAPAAAPKAKPKITVWCGTTYTTEADALQDKQIKDWCAQNNVDVELLRMASDERTPKWKTAFETKAYPDMGSLELNDAPKFAVAGDLVNTDTQVATLNKLEGGYTAGAATDNIMPDGKNYTFPSFSSVEVFYVRKDKLAAKNLKVPETWDDVMAASKALNDPKNNFWGYGAQIGTPSWDSEAQESPTMWGYGANAWDKDGKVAIDSPETRKVLDWYRELWKAGVVPPDATTWDDSGNNKAYLTGTVAMIWNTPSVLAVMEKDQKDLLANSTITSIPAGPKGHFHNAYFYKWGVFKNSKNVDVCLNLASYILQPAQLRPVYNLSAGNMMPVFQNMLNDDMWKTTPERQTVVQSVKYGQPQGYPGATKPWIIDAWMAHTTATMFSHALIDNWDNDKAIADGKANLQKFYDDWQKLLKK